MTRMRGDTKKIESTEVGLPQTRVLMFLDSRLNNLCQDIEGFDELEADEKQEVCESSAVVVAV
jgi:hypothetical protein